MKGLFEITVSDSFCTWRFQLNPEAGGKLSINDIMDVLYEHLKAPKDVGVNVSTEMEEQMIAFGEWLSNNQWQGDSGTWFKETQEPIRVGDQDGYVVGYITSTTEELYNEFLKSM